MNGLAKDLIEEIKNKLVQNQQEVTKRIEELTVQDPFEDPERLNDNAASDREASEEDGHDRVQALLIELNQQKEAIGSALDRIADGSYGICANCGKPIEPERLKAFPTATTCISCQSKK